MNNILEILLSWNSETMQNTEKQNQYTEIQRGKHLWVPVWTVSSHEREKISFNIFYIFHFFHFMIAASCIMHHALISLFKVIPLVIKKRAAKHGKIRWSHWFHWASLHKFETLVKGFHVQGWQWRRHSYGNKGIAWGRLKNISWNQGRSEGGPRVPVILPLADFLLF